MSKISNSLNRPASPASLRVLALCEARRPGPPCKVDCGAELHKAPARAELRLPEFLLMNKPGLEPGSLLLRSRSFARDRGGESSLKALGLVDHD